MLLRLYLAHEFLDLSSCFWFNETGWNVTEIYRYPKSGAATFSQLGRRRISSTPSFWLPGNPGIWNIKIGPNRNFAGYKFKRLLLRSMRLEVSIWYPHKTKKRMGILANIDVTSRYRHFVAANGCGAGDGAWASDYVSASDFGVFRIDCCCCHLFNPKANWK